MYPSFRTHQHSNSPDKHRTRHAASPPQPSPPQQARTSNIQNQPLSAILNAVSINNDNINSLVDSATSPPAVDFSNKQAFNRLNSISSITATRLPSIARFASMESVRSFTGSGLAGLSVQRQQSLGFTRFINANDQVNSLLHKPSSSQQNYQAIDEVNGQVNDSQREAEADAALALLLPQQTLSTYSAPSMSPTARPLEPNDQLPFSLKQLAPAQSIYNDTQHNNQLTANSTIMQHPQQQQRPYHSSIPDPSPLRYTLSQAPQFYDTINQSTFPQAYVYTQHSADSLQQPQRQSTLTSELYNRSTPPSAGHLLYNADRPLEPELALSTLSQLSASLRQSVDTINDPSQQIDVVLTRGPSTFDNAYMNPFLQSLLEFSASPCTIQVMPREDVSMPPVFVNSRQFTVMLKRRRDHLIMAAKARIRLKHASRQAHAARRMRGQGGRFLTKQQVAALQQKQQQQQQQTQTAALAKLATQPH